MSGLREYASLVHLGHRNAHGILDTATLVIEEKIDGSQMSWGRVEQGVPAIEVRSRHSRLTEESAGKLFGPAFRHLTGPASEAMPVGWTFRGEAVGRPKHNVLAYDRVPAGGVVLWEVEDANGCALDPEALASWAELLGIEAVPILARGPVSRERADAMVNGPSMLGGAGREGIVLKEYGANGLVRIAKSVSPAFREVKSPAKTRLATSEPWERIAAKYAVPARYAKARGRLAEQGLLSGSARDIPALMAAVRVDVEAECGEDITRALWGTYGRRALAAVGAGAAEWYRALLDAPAGLRAAEPSASDGMMRPAPHAGPFCRPCMEDARARTDSAESACPSAAVPS